MIKRRVECNKYSGSLPVHQIFLCQAVFGLVIYRAPRIPMYIDSLVGPQTTAVEGNKLGDINPFIE